MKVAFISMQFPVPSETFASNDVRWLVSRGVDIRVYGLRSVHERARQLRNERDLASVPVSHNDMGATVRGLAFALSRPVLLTKALAWLWRSSWRNPGQLVRSVGLLPRAFDVLHSLADRTSIPDVVHLAWGHYPSIVGYLVQETLPEVSTTISLAAYDLTAEFGGSVRVARRADFVRTLARHNVAHIARFTGVPRDRIEVVHDGVDLARIEAIANQVEKVPYRVAVASRLIESKRVDYAIRCFASVHERWPQATLVVMGDGPDRHRLERLCQELGIEQAVSFEGHIPHEQVLRELASSEVALMTSVKSSERLPNAVKEGMACGCICVVSETPGIGELVRDGVSGFVCPAGDVGAVEEALNRIFERKVDVTSVAQQAREVIETRFDLRRTADRYIELWQRALAERRGLRDPKNSPERTQLQWDDAFEKGVVR